MPNDTKVQGEPNGEVADATLAAGVDTQATPGTQPSDAGKLAEIEAVRAKYESDLNAMKSSLQRNEAKLREEFASKQAALEQELEKVRVANMDVDQRKEYEAGSAQRRLAQMEQKLYEVENERVEKEAMLKAQNYFLQNGVPPEVLNVDEGYDVMWQAGNDYLINELRTLRQAASSTQPNQKPPVVTAPEVVTQANTPANTGTTWEELHKRFGPDDDVVYRLIETGQLPASILPVPK